MIRKQRLFVLSLLIICLGLAVGNYVGWKFFSEQLAEYRIQGESMLPAFSHNDLVLVDAKAFEAAEPARGEVIVFRFSHLSTPYIKRVVAIPGDEVMITNWQILINNRIYGPAGRYNKILWPEGQAQTIASGKYFVLSDNSASGEDSRQWGLVSKKDLLGKLVGQQDK